jgi:ABC-type polysaccharide/polyol phosphate transport system ATPase subunit
MNDIALTLENVSKYYRLGEHLNTRTQYSDFKKLFGSIFKPQRPAAETRFDEEGDDLWALKDVSLEVRRGEAIGIVGRNGAGKSTLVKIISQITAPTRGTVKLYGRVSALLGVGAGFHPDMTGRENVYMNGVVMGMSRRQIDRKFDDIVAFSEIERFIETPVKRYSKGMKTRLAVSIALNLDPDILVVDEVLAVGDIRFRDQCMDKIADVIRGGTTLLFISHSVARISRLCTRAILLREGRLVSSGPTEDILNEYLEVDIKDESQVDEDEQGAKEAREVVRVSETSEKPDEPPTTEPPVYAVIDSLDPVSIGGEQLLPQLPVTEDFRLRMRFRLLKAPVEVSGAIACWANNQLVFGIRQPPEHVDAPGGFDLFLTIPKFLMAEIVYKVTASLSVHEQGVRNVIRYPLTLKLRPYDPRDIGKEKNRGVVAPQLEWRMEAAPETPPTADPAPAVDLPAAAHPRPESGESHAV